MVSYALALDSSGRPGTLALARTEPGDGLTLLEERALSDSDGLVATLAGLLADHRIEATAIVRWLTLRGPGSFTGLRNGYAAVKGWSLADDVAWDTFDASEVRACAFLRQSPQPVGHTLAVVTPVGRKRIVAALFRVEETGVQWMQEEVIEREDFDRSPFAAAQTILADVETLSAAVLLREHRNLRRSERFETVETKASAEPRYQGTAAFKDLAQQRAQ